MPTLVVIWFRENVVRGWAIAAPFGRVIMEPISCTTIESRTLRGTGLHAIGRIFGQAAVDDFLGRGVILVVRQESGSTPVLMDSWNKSVKSADSSLAAYLRARLERPS